MKLDIQMKINKNERAVVTTYIRHNCTVADWFLLYQIADNMDSYFLEQLLLELSSNSAASNDQPGEATNLIRNEMYEYYRVDYSKFPIDFGLYYSGLRGHTNLTPFVVDTYTTK